MTVFRSLRSFLTRNVWSFFGSKTVHHMFLVVVLYPCSSTCAAMYCFLFTLNPQARICRPAQGCICRPADCTASSFLSTCRRQYLVVRKALYVILQLALLLLYSHPTGSNMSSCARLYMSYRLHCLFFTLNLQARICRHVQGFICRPAACIASSFLSNVGSNMSSNAQGAGSLPL